MMDSVQCLEAIIRASKLNQSNNIKGLLSLHACDLDLGLQIVFTLLSGICFRFW